MAIDWDKLFNASFLFQKLVKYNFIQENPPIGVAVQNATTFILWWLSYILLTVTCSENIYARPYIYCSRPEAAIDVIAGTFMWQSTANKAVNYGNPRLNRSRDIRPKAADIKISVCLSSMGICRVINILLQA